MHECDIQHIQRIYLARYTCIIYCSMELLTQPVQKYHFPLSNCDLLILMHVTFDTEEICWGGILDENYPFNLGLEACFSASKTLIVQ